MNTGKYTGHVIEVKGKDQDLKMIIIMLLEVLMKMMLKDIVATNNFRTWNAL